MGIQSQLDISFSQAKLPVVRVDCIRLSQRGPMEIPKQPRLVLGQRVVLCKQRAGIHCCRQRPHSSLNV